jgi:hypothetical protein
MRLASRPNAQPATNRSYSTLKVYMTATGARNARNRSGTIPALAQSKLVNQERSKLIAATLNTDFKRSGKIRYVGMHRLDKW